MANFTNSNLVKAQARLQEQFRKHEMRVAPSPAVLLAMKNQSALIPNHEQYRTREDRAVSGYMMNRVKRSVITGRTHNHTGNSGTSSEFPFTWSTVGDKFSISLKQMDNNIFSFEEALAHEILNAAININAELEKKLTNYLFTNRSQVKNVTTAKGGTWNGTNYAFEVAAADEKTYFLRAKSWMEQNKYSGQLDVLSDVNDTIKARILANQGNANEFNSAFQFLGMNLYGSTQFDDANYTNGASLAMPEGSFSMQDWIPRQNREGRGDYNSVLGGYGSMPDPLGSGLNFAVHGYTTRADTSARNGVAQDDLLEMEITVDISPVLSKLSVANESVVFEIAQGA